MPWWIWIALAAVVLLAADRLLIAAERRRWIYYRNAPSRRTSAGNALLSIEAIFSPDKQHVVEERTAIRTDEDEDGEPPGS